MFFSSVTTRQCSCEHGIALAAPSVLREISLSAAKLTPRPRLTFLRGLEVLAGGAVALEGVVGAAEAGTVEGTVGDAVVAADGEAGLAALGITPQAALDELGMGGDKVFHVCLVGAERSGGRFEMFDGFFHGKMMLKGFWMIFYIFEEKFNVLLGMMYF